MLKKIFLLSVCFILSSCSTSYHFDEGDANTDAYHTGMRYMTGRGVPQNYTTAVAWLKKSADTGNPYAQSELGYLYMVGKGVSQDYGSAIRWYKRAADHGLASAQYNLALMYAHGIGTSVDKAKARYLFTQAAQRGFEPAKRALTSN